MALMETPTVNLGTTAVDFNLLGTDGKYWSLADCRGKNGILIMFLCNHCPYVQAILDRLLIDSKALYDIGVGSVAIMPNDTVAYPEDHLEKMTELATRKNFPFPYLIDHSQQIARAYGAVCTPDFFGYNRDLQLQYRGRIGANEKHASDDNRELYAAMKQIANTGRGPAQQVPSMGCSIKWRD